MIGRPPSSPLFPYTTLFRSVLASRSTVLSYERPVNADSVAGIWFHSLQATSQALQPMQRSEEHTSELQSHSDLVCRLLLEKKKKKQKKHTRYSYACHQTNPY